MNNRQVKEFIRHCTIWSPKVASFDWGKVPGAVKKCLSDDEIKTYAQLPLLNPDNKIILINESFDGWDALKDILVSLDLLPDSLIIDIYKMDSKKFGKVDCSNVVGKDEEESRRKLILLYIPDVLRVHGIDMETIK